MKKIFLATLLAASVVPATSQETYENAKVIAEDLNGTARYVGMGGAMEALGADISTIASNPAGIGLFRRSTASVSFGFVSQGDAASMSGAKATYGSFDQAGFVWSTNTSGRKQSFFNFAFNYHKSRNFDYILAAASPLYNASQNKLTFAKATNYLLYEYKADGVPDFDHPYLSCSQIDGIYAKAYDKELNQWTYVDASGYDMRRAHKGYVGEYDFNLSGNINNQVYLGLSVGIHDVHYRHHGEYTENMDPVTVKPFDLTVSEDRRITGTGYDVKFGAIFRPIDYSPFRFGLYVHTPTFYTLTTSNEIVVTLTTINENAFLGGVAPVSSGESYKFKLHTPWKFGASIGHTIGTQLALGATYEYASYGSTDTRYITGSYYNYWNNYSYDRSESDELMNEHTENTLKGVHTLKLGAELKPTDDLAVRVGYNYVSPMYESEGFKDVTIDSDGTFTASATDYTNWRATHRVTAGVGYTLGQFNLSAAYQLSTTRGDFSPFCNYVGSYDAGDAGTVPLENVADPVKVKNTRHQLLFTLGYTF